MVIEDISGLQQQLVKYEELINDERAYVTARELLGI